MTAPTRHDVTIEGLFCSGHTFDRIVSTGEATGWSRDDVMAVLRTRQWDLDPSGRLPRGKRVTTPLGLRALPPAPAPRAKPAKPARGAAADRRRAQGQPQEPTPPVLEVEPTVQADVDLPVEWIPTEPETVVTGLDLGLECDVWFAEAQRSPSRRVQLAAGRAIASLLAFRCAMDDLARAERHATSSSRRTGEPT